MHTITQTIFLYCVYTYEKFVTSHRTSILLTTNSERKENRKKLLIHSYVHVKYFFKFFAAIAHSSIDRKLLRKFQCFWKEI